MSHQKSKSFFRALSKVIRVVGWAGIIVQIVLYFNPTKPTEPIIDNSGEIIFKEVEHIKYYFTEPLNWMIYGVVNLSPDHFLTGLAEILGKNAFLIIGTILVVHRQISSFIVIFSSKGLRLFQKFYGRVNKSTTPFSQSLFTWLKIENEGVKRIFVLLLFIGGLLFGLILAIDEMYLFIPGFVLGILIIFFSFKIYSWVKEGFINSKKQNSK